jgi:hypothetical protein
LADEETLLPNVTNGEIGGIAAISSLSDYLCLLGGFAAIGAEFSLGVPG